MGWEVRNGRRYLYRSRRVNGRPVREYLVADDRFGFGELMASELERLQGREADVRRLQRESRIAFQQRIDGLHAANTTLRLAAEGLIVSVGFHKHKRGEWRMRRDLAQLKDTISELERLAAEKRAMVKYDAPPGDAEAAELFANARSGDADAQARLFTLIRDRSGRTGSATSGAKRPVN